MCGIVGYVGDEQAAPILLAGLSKLEYRGYDSAGIAVRSIAPFIQSKKKDPAVLVVDELGKFVISLLSGHLGGANELACLAADILQAIPVVTTATDLEGKFAVDVFAKQNNCHIFRMRGERGLCRAAGR